MTNAINQDDFVSGAVRVHHLENGMTLLMERMPHLQSAAFNLMLPAGTSSEPSHLAGVAAITVEMMQRGAGLRSSRQIIEDLDFLGVERDSHVSSQHSSFSAAMIDRYLFDTLRIYSDILRKPHLPEDQLEDARATALQEIAALQDDAAQRCLHRLRRLRYGPVFGRNSSGSVEAIEAIAIDDVRQQFAEHIHAHGSILSIAGNIDYNETVEAVESLFGDWKNSGGRLVEDVPAFAGYEHISEDTNQTQIALAYDAVPYDHEKYYESRALINILGDGMSSRLFTEVREKRGLVYTVSASPQSIAKRSSVVVYAGTTTARADETLDVVLQTISGLALGISDCELKRLKARVKTSLVFEQESCNSRSSQNATDWYYLGRIVDRKEVSHKIDGLTTAILVQHAIDHPPHNQSLVTLGEQKLNYQNAV